MIGNVYNNFVAVTPNDAANIAVGRIRGILLSKGTDEFANVAVHNEAGTAVTLTGLRCGVIHPVSTLRVMNTNTNATTITVFW